VPLILRPKMNRRVIGAHAYHAIQRVFSVAMLYQCNGTFNELDFHICLGGVLRDSPHQSQHHGISRGSCVEP
jgi:hypothetical protein